MEIELSNVCYKNKLIDINYKFQDNRITSIIGRSGSGKSLIGYIIMDLINKDSGDILIDGSSNYNVYKLMKDVGYVFQNPREHFFSKTVYDEIAFGLKQFRFKLNKIDMQIRDSLKMVGLDDTYINREINTLSSGEMERVAIASSLVLNPKVLILDEPTIYLDAKVKKELIRLIKILKNKYNKTVIIMSNDIDFVYSVSDNYVLMDKGCIVIDGTLNDLMANNNILYNFGIEIPLINQFIDMAKSRCDINLKYTTEISELVKEVMDSV